MKKMANASHMAPMFSAAGAAVMRGQPGFNCLDV